MNFSVVVREIDQLELTHQSDSIACLNETVAESPPLQQSFLEINDAHAAIRKELFEWEPTYAALMARIEEVEKKRSNGEVELASKQKPAGEDAVGWRRTLVGRVNSDSVAGMKKTMEQIQSR